MAQAGRLGCRALAGLPATRALDRAEPECAKWSFEPAVAEGGDAGPGTMLGTVDRVGRIDHRVVVPG